jgi:hypothetical protein
VVVGVCCQCFVLGLMVSSILLKNDGETIMYPQHPDDLADEIGDGYGSNEHARAHASMTMVARSQGLIGGKAEAIEKARKFVKNGIQAVILGSPCYSELDAVMGYNWSLVLVGNADTVQKFLNKLDEIGSDGQVKVIK